MKSIFSVLLCFAIVQPSFSQATDSSELFYQKGLQEKTARRTMVAYNNFQKSVDLKKDNPDAQTELGLSAIELRKYGNAETAFLKVNDLRKDDTVAVANLANLYFWTHQWKQ